MLFFYKECFCQLCFHNWERRLDPDCCLCCAFMRHSWQCMLDGVVLKGWCQPCTCTHNKPQSGKCICHSEYVIVIQHGDAPKPLFQNTLLFKASENPGAPCWDVEHLWFNKFSEYHGLRCFFVCLQFFHWRTLPSLTIMMIKKNPMF